MSVHLLVQRALQNSLVSAEKSKQIGFKQVGFASKALLKEFPELDAFADESLFMLLAELCRSTEWAVSMQPNAIEDVAGLEKIKLKIDLNYFDQVAHYCAYTAIADLPDKQWQDHNEKLQLPYHDFRWRKWGRNFSEVVENIQRAVTLLTKHELSQHQLSALLVHNAKQLEEKDIEQLLTLHPTLRANLRMRRVILNYHCISEPSCCLVVENMDTYHYLRQRLPSDWLLVCGLGQRVTKQEVRSAAIVDLHASSETPVVIQKSCVGYWQAGSGQFLYWGDLDARGEAIFQALKKQISQLEKWQPAYNAMLEYRLKNEIDEVHQEAILLTDLGLKNE